MTSLRQKHTYTYKTLCTCWYTYNRRATLVPQFSQPLIPFTNTKIIQNTQYTHTHIPPSFPPLSWHSSLNSTRYIFIPPLCYCFVFCSHKYLLACRPTTYIVIYISIFIEGVPKKLPFQNSLLAPKVILDYLRPMITNPIPIQSKYSCEDDLSI